jgi:hypothetical protein
MDLVGYSTCVPYIVLHQWNFYIPGFIYYLNGVLSEWSFQKLSSIEPKLKKGI